MTQGRKPVPIELKILRGNPGKRPIANDAPRADGTIPECPKYLKGEARREWKRITQELANLRVISAADRVSIELYCDAYARWRYAREQIEDDSSMIMTTEKGYQIQSPWVSIANGAVAQMQKFLSEYGLTASSRAKVKVEKPQEESLTDKLKKAVNGN
jgi:P27 family predicted phage terminase small subunit